MPPVILTVEVTTRVGLVISATPYCCPRGQPKPVICQPSTVCSAVRWQPLGHTMQISSCFIG